MTRALRIDLNLYFPKVDIYCTKGSSSTPHTPSPVSAAPVF